MWIDREWSSTHTEGHRLMAFIERGAMTWWFCHRDHKRVRLQTVGPEPLGPFTTRNEAKAAAAEAFELNDDKKPRAKRECA